MDIRTVNSDIKLDKGMEYEKSKKYKNIYTGNG